MWWFHIRALLLHVSFKRRLLRFPLLFFQLWLPLSMFFWLTNNASFQCPFSSLWFLFHLNLPKSLKCSWVEFLPLMAFGPSDCAGLHFSIGPTTVSLLNISSCIRVLFFNDFGKDVIVLLYQAHSHWPAPRWALCTYLSVCSSEYNK